MRYRPSGPLVASGIRWPFVVKLSEPQARPRDRPSARIHHATTEFDRGVWIVLGRGRRVHDRSRGRARSDAGPWRRGFLSFGPARGKEPANRGRAATPSAIAAATFSLDTNIAWITRAVSSATARAVLLSQRATARGRQQHLGDHHRRCLGRQGRGDRACRDSNASPGQSLPQESPRPDEAAPDRPDGPAQTLSRLVAGQPFQVAKHHREPEPIGQAVDLGVKKGPELVIGSDRRCPQDGGLNCPFLPCAAADSVSPGLQRHPVGDPMQPAAERLADPEHSRLADEDQERRLERILGGMRIAEYSPADGQHHRAVPRHQGHEGRLVALSAKPPHELRVGQPRDGPLAEQPFDLPQHGPRVHRRHGARLRVTPDFTSLAVMRGVSGFAASLFPESFLIVGKRNNEGPQVAALARCRRLDLDRVGIIEQLRHPGDGWGNNWYLSPGASPSMRKRPAASVRTRSGRCSMPSAPGRGLSMR